MLKEVEAQAKERGWAVVSETASTGLADRLVTEGLPWIAQQLDSPAHARRVSGVSLPMSLGAGLPSTVNDLLSDDVLTLLRRADRHNLAAVAAADVADALRQPIEATSRQIEDDALAEAADGTGGYPFLIQLIGYWIWRIRDAATEIDPGAGPRGLLAARRRMGSLVHEPALFDLSQVDRTFLAAMAVDAGPSRMADIATRLNSNPNYASQYRLRLIGAGMIRPVGHRYVDFAVPYLGDYLREHAASLGL